MKSDKENVNNLNNIAPKEILCNKASAQAPNLYTRTQHT